MIKYFYIDQSSIIRIWYDLLMPMLHLLKLFKFTTMINFIFQII